MDRTGVFSAHKNVLFYTAGIYFFFSIVPSFNLSDFFSAGHVDHRNYCQLSNSTVTGLSHKAFIFVYNRASRGSSATAETYACRLISTATDAIGHTFCQDGNIFSTFS